MRIQAPQKIVEVLYGPGHCRFKVLYGGRGSAKSWSVADYLLQKAAYGKVRILCVREVQNSIKDSVHKLLCDRIAHHKLQAFFKIGRDTITGIYGSEFLFKGIKHSASEIKSTEGVDICWFEEAEKATRESWKTLLPTIRKKGSEIIVTFNPEDEKADTYIRFIEKDGVPVDMPGLRRAWVNWWDNPWFDETELVADKDYDRKNDPEMYEHVWGGRPKKYGQAVIFKNKLRVENFETHDGVQFFFGEDFGFSVDPLAFVRCYIVDMVLYIDREFYGVGVEFEEIEVGMDSIPKSRDYKIRADNQRPDTISYLKRKGFNIVATEKGPGSVEDGIEFLKSFKAIVVHKTNCPGTAKDFGNYRWKEDRVTGEILPIPVDKSNHGPDAVRYALEPYIKQKKTIWEAMK